MQMSCKFFKVEIKHDGDLVVIFNRGDIIRIMQGTKRRLFSSLFQNKASYNFRISNTQASDFWTVCLNKFSTSFEKESIAPSIFETQAEIE